MSYKGLRVGPDYTQLAWPGGQSSKTSGQVDLEYALL